MEPGAWEESRGAWFQGRFSHLFPSVVCILQSPSIRFMDLLFEKVLRLSAVERTSGIRALRRHSIPLFPRHAYCGWLVRHHTDLDYAEFHPLERSRDDGVPSPFGRKRGRGGFLWQYNGFITRGKGSRWVNPGGGGEIGRCEKEPFRPRGGWCMGRAWGSLWCFGRFLQKGTRNTGRPMCGGMGEKGRSLSWGTEAMLGNRGDARGQGRFHSGPWPFGREGLLGF
jgi:hypothetical protein